MCLFALSWDILKDNYEGIVALCALFITIYESLSNRRFNRLSVKPYLVIKRDIHKIGNLAAEVKISVINTGLGPAFIDSFRFFHKKTIISDNNHFKADEYVSNLLDKLVESKTIGGNNKGYAMQIGETLELLSIKFVYEKISFKDMISLIDELDIDIDYLSAYGCKSNLNTF